MRATGQLPLRGAADHHPPAGFIGDHVGDVGQAAGHLPPVQAALQAG